MDNMTKLNILLDYITRTVGDLQTIKTAMIINDGVALHALLRYYRHLRDYTGWYEPTQYKRGIATELCDIIEAYLKEHKEKEVETWTETV